jgi:multidrug efflux system membrane fusion protein
MRRSWIIALAVALLAGGWILSGQLDWRALTGEDFAEAAEPDASGQAAEPAPLTVRVARIEAEPYVDRMVLQGRTLADRSVTVRAETSGVVEEVLAARGERVRDGDLLVRLEVEERDARLAEAHALVREREIQYSAALSLNERGYRADTQLAQAEAQLNAARAALRLAELELDNVRVRAPFDGIVADRYVELGDFVDLGEPIARVMDLDPIRVVVQVAERYTGRIRVGDPGSAQLVDGRVVEGTVGYVGPAASETTRTFPVELEIANPDARVIEGLTAQVRLPVDEIAAHHVSPMVLTLADDGTVGVKAVDDGNRVVFHPAEVIGGDDDGVWLVGLPESLRVILVGQEFVVDGQIVEPVAAGNGGRGAGTS